MTATKARKRATLPPVLSKGLQVESWPITQVKPYARNPRKNAGPPVEKVANSIREFGFRQPIVVDPKGVIIAGHTRLLAALHLGLTDVPVHVAKGLTEAQVKAYRLADNRTAEEAEWDTDLLGQEFADLKALDFDLSLTGFEPNEWAQVGGGLKAGVDPDSVPDLPKQAVSREGDLIQLGPHRLLCGDATRVDHWERLMAGEQASLFWTDPPYGVGYEAKNEHLKAWDGRLERPSHASSVTNDTASTGVLRAFLADAFRLGWVHTREGGTWYVAGPAFAGPAWAFFSVLFELGVWRNSLVWVKDSFVIGRTDYHYRHEVIALGWKEGGAHYFVDDRTQDTVWEIPRPKASKEHPTMKPVELVARAIRNSSKPGDLVVDPFAGSGTTLIAAEQEGRRAFLMEIDPRYADVIVSRWETATGQTAVRPKVAA